MSAGRTPVAPVWAILLSVALVAAGGGCWGTNSPTVVFDPANAGGGGGPALPPTPPTPPGPSSAPASGSLLQAGPPTLDGTAPTTDATGVDVLAPVALWFSESLRAGSASSLDVLLRPVENPIVSLPYQRTWLIADRLLVMQPTLPLQTNTEYEIVLTEGITDLDGERFVPPEEGTVLRFTTASQSSGVAPRVLGSFPPAGATHQPNDRAATLVFSKPMNFTGITAAVTIVNLTTGLDGAYDRNAGPGNRHAGNRVFTFPHLDDLLDLAAHVQIGVDDSLTDVEFVPQSLAAPYTASWRTLAFARPTTLEPFDAAPADPFPSAVNLTNIDSFDVDVILAPGAQASDQVTLRVHDSVLAVGTEAVRSGGAGAPRFNLDLTEPGSGLPLFASDTELALGAFVERGGRRSTVRTREDTSGAEITVPHDTVPPVLFQYGPPVGLFGSQFLTDLPELRPYGSASEPIARIETEFPPGMAGVVRDVFFPSASRSFVGSSFDPGGIAEGPFPFDIRLTDVAGNESLLPSPGAAVFRGFASSATLPGGGGSLRVIAFDRETLSTVPGALVYVEDAGGGNEDSAMTGSDGATVLPSRSGAQTVTVVAPGYHAYTLHGSDSAELSLPLASVLVPVASAAVAPEGVNSGILTVGGSSLYESTGGEDPAASQDVDLGAGIFGDGVDLRLFRPGWFAAFHDLRSFPSATYLRLLSLEPRVLVEAATGTQVPVLALPMRQSLNEVSGTTDYVYDITASPGAGFNIPAEDLRVLITTSIPGIGGQVAVGAGEMAAGAGSPNAGAELELGLHGDAVLEGADPSTVYLHVYGRDADGEVALVREPVTVAASPGPVAVTFPDLPASSTAWGGSSYPFTRDFDDTLAGGPGWYRIVIRDSQTFAAEWHVWIEAGSAGGGSFTLPTLADSPGGPVGQPPLVTDPGSTWTAFVEAFEMPAGYGPSGFFFQEVYREFLSWARAEDGPALVF